MELITTKSRQQLKSTLVDLEKLAFTSESYFALKKSDEMDEFIAANEQGMVEFAKTLLQSVVEREGGYALLDYNVLASDSDMRPVYVEFVDRPPRKTVKVLTTSPQRFNIDKPLHLALYLFGLFSGFVCLITGAYTIFSALLQ